MTFTILYKQQSSRKVTISSTSSKFSSHHSKKHRGFKSEMGHWVKSFAITDTYHLYNQTGMHLNLKWMLSPPTDPIRALFQNITSHLISYLNLFMTSLYAILLFQLKENFTAKVVKHWISGGMLIFGDSWNPATCDPKQAGLTLKLALHSARSWPSWPWRYLNFFNIKWLSFFLLSMLLLFNQICVGIYSFLKVVC